ncbi:MAG: hypothetical protein JW781_04625 [Deltaproteobacteria bacterium]|nr:hypothetical protein [Candidatus Anaeroferrophillacea bacterium]
MQISAANITLASSHLLQESVEKHERLEVRVDGRLTDRVTDNIEKALAELPADRLQLRGRARSAAVEALETYRFAGRESSPPARDAARRGSFGRGAIDRGGFEVGHSAGTGTATAADEPPSVELSPEDQQKIRIIERLWEQLTGKRVRLAVADGFVARRRPAPEAVAAQNVEVPAEARQGWGVAYDYQEIHRESEAMSFTAAGTVTTADGRELSIDVGVTMSREFVDFFGISLRAGDPELIDPLVINLDGQGVTLTDEHVIFDLDADGATEEISFVAPGSGFLALDKNGDGIINDGSELFGPASGDGFQDLAAWDGDGNQWIDEADPVFDRLRIWTKGADGEDRLIALGQAGVGAIYLGHLDTVFSLRDRANEEQGRLRASSIYLRENGAAGTIQQVDLVG